MTRKHKRTLISLTSILMSLSGGVLYVAHDITHVSVVPDTWSDKWAILVILAGILNKAGQSIINHLAPEKQNAERTDAKSHLRSHPDSAADPNSVAVTITQPNAGTDSAAKSNTTSISTSSA